MSVAIRPIIRPQHQPRWRRGALAGALAAVVLATGAGQARATIQPAVTLDGPSEEIVGFGGAAMAEDGTGGVVYLKRVDGVAHVFVARYDNGAMVAADPRSTPASPTRPAGRASARPTAASWWSCGRPRSRPKTAGRSTSCSARRSAPGRRRSAKR